MAGRRWPLLLGAILTAASLGASCPDACSCKWKGGKEWVECASKNLRAVPMGAREETQVLDLSGNHLDVLPTKVFSILKLTNLQRLYLSNSHLTDVTNMAFDGLSGLVGKDKI